MPDEEEEELIKIYGERIRVIRWCFEDDRNAKVIMDKKKKGLLPAKVAPIRRGRGKPLKR